MVYVLYLIYAVGTQPVAQHLGTFENPAACKAALVAYTQPRAFPASFIKKLGTNILKCRLERKA